MRLRKVRKCFLGSQLVRGAVRIQSQLSVTVLLTTGSGVLNYSCAILPFGHLVKPMDHFREKCF